MDKELIAIIDNTCEFIRKYDMNEFSKKIVNFTNLIVDYSKDLNEAEILNFSKVLNLMYVALENKDYVLLLDILDIKLREFIINRESTLG